jgi:hypothetical protein
MERFTVLFRGVAIGVLDDEIVDGVLMADLSPLPGLEAVRQALGDASRAFGNFGFLPPTGEVAGGVSHEGAAAGEAASAAAQAVCEELELRDSKGRLVPAGVDYVFGGRTADEPFTLTASIDDARSVVPAKLSIPPRRGSGHQPPAG